MVAGNNNVDSENLESTSFSKMLTCFVNCLPHIKQVAQRKTGADGTQAAMVSRFLVYVQMKLVSMNFPFLLLS